MSFGGILHTQPLHAPCLVYLQVGRNAELELSQNSGIGVLQSKVGKKYDLRAKLSSKGKLIQILNLEYLEFMVLGDFHPLE